MYVSKAGNIIRVFNRPLVVNQINRFASKDKSSSSGAPGSKKLEKDKLGQKELAENYGSTEKQPTKKAGDESEKGEQLAEKVKKQKGEKVDPPREKRKNEKVKVPNK